MVYKWWEIVTGCDVIFRWTIQIPVRAAGTQIFQESSGPAPVPLASDQCTSCTMFEIL